MIQKKSYKLYNSIQNYEWGTFGDEAFIPKFLNIFPEQKPYAELWIGAHPSLSSKIEIDNQYYELHKLIQDYTYELLGFNVAKVFGERLPYLLKVLSAGKALSIQTHPNKVEAEELHKIDPANYPDDNHKPEIAIVLDNLDALVGFQSVKSIRNNLDDYPPLVDFLGEDSIRSIDEIFSEEEILKVLFTSLMSKTEKEDELNSCIESIESIISLKDILSRTDRLFIELKEQYGIDIGLLTIFFLDHLRLAEGEAIFTPAGIPHAYLKGNIVECMANSDNVVRAGLTPKFKDVKTLLDIMDYSTTKPLLEAQKNDEGVITFDPNIKEFKLDKITLEHEDNSSFKTNDQIEIVLITHGSVKVRIEEFLVETNYTQGETFLIPAIVKKYFIEAEGSLTMFRVTVPISHPE